MGKARVGYAVFGYRQLLQRDEPRKVAEEAVAEVVSPQIKHF